MHKKIEEMTLVAFREENNFQHFCHIAWFQFYVKNHFSKIYPSDGWRDYPQRRISAIDGSRSLLPDKTSRKGDFLQVESLRRRRIRWKGYVFWRNTVLSASTVYNKDERLFWIILGQLEPVQLELLPHPPYSM